MSQTPDSANNHPELYLQSEPLPVARSLDDFRLHQAAMEWSLADPIIIATPEDIKSRPNWQERLQPFEHQVRNLITFCRRLPVTLLADDVGLGKTISAGLILSELMTRNRVRRTLVICPSILGPQWVEELEAKFQIFARFSRGTELDHELQSECPVVVTTYQSIQPRLKTLQSGQFDMMILDEAHKLRNLYGTERAPKMARGIHQALSEELFEFVLMLTATPIQNRLWDLYSLVDCLAAARNRPNPFGFPWDFRERYIADASKGARRLKQGQQEHFRHVLSQYLVRTRRNDVRLLFPRREVRLRRVEPSQLDQELQEIVADHIEQLNGLQQSSLLQAMMSSPRALVAQLRNMAGRDDRWGELAALVERRVEASGLPSKMMELLELVSELQVQRPTYWRLVVFTIRVETQRLICDALTDAGVAFGTIQGGMSDRNVQTVKRFTQNPPAIHVIVSTDAGAEGLNLQAGNVVVNYDLPWNPMIVEQRIGRVQRLASEHGTVVIWNLAVEDSPEERVVQRLLEKLQTIVESVGDIEIVLGADENDGAESSFESDIRRMVIKSLEGKDVTRDTELKIQSMTRAKQLFEEQRHELDETLGRLDAEHTRGPSVPKVTRRPPGRDHQTFSLDVYRAEGFTLADDTAGCLRAEKPRQSTEFVTFDESYFRQQSQSGVFNGRLLRLCLPGRPHFEKMVQRWVDRSACAVASAMHLTQPGTKTVIEHWLKNRLPAFRLESIRIQKRTPHFQGRCQLKATASTGVDSYEKLIELSVVPDRHHSVYKNELEASDRLLTVEVSPLDVIPSFEQSAETVCHDDADVRAFCDFYSERLCEELQKRGDDPARIRKAENDFKPRIHARSVSLEGIRYETVRVEATLQQDGHRRYPVTLTVCPVTGQVLEQPDAWAECDVTRQSVPADFLETCVISRKRVLKHFLRVSDESGRQALEEFVSACPVTGRFALQDEFLISDVSGTRAVASCFVYSELSRRRGLPDESVICDFTGIRLLVDEVCLSDVSGKRYRHDQQATSILSGRQGHQSEFVPCDFTQSTVLPEEAVLSDCSGRRMRRDLQEHSTRPPNRVGGPGELQTCDLTGARLLQDELGRCESSGKLVDDQFLERSTSGRLSLPEHLVNCEVTGERLIPDEAVTSSVSGKVFAKRLARRSIISGRLALSEECELCGITGCTVLPDELEPSSVSGKQFRRDEAVCSEKSGRVAHETEAGRCAVSGRLLLSDELVRSDISSRRVDALLAVTSEMSNRKGLPEEGSICEMTDTPILVDELKTSDVSGKRFRNDQVVRSDASQRIGHLSEAARCEVTGRLLLHDELMKSDISGRLVSNELAVCSPVSGRIGLPGEFASCAITGVSALADELVTSDVSGKQFRRDEAVCSEKSGRVAHRSESDRCVVSGKMLLSDELVKSEVSGRCVDCSLAIHSQITGRIALPSEAAVCEVTGSQVISDELQQSNVSGRFFRCDQAAYSDLYPHGSTSRRIGHQSESGICEASGKLLLSDELVKSDISGRLVSKELAVCSPVSGRIGLPGEFASCEITGVSALADELVTSDVSGKQFRRDEAVCSEKSGRLAHRSEVIRCDFTRMWLLPDETARSDVSGRRFDVSLTRVSEISGRCGLPDECIACEITGASVLLDELQTSDVSGKRFRSDQVARSDVSQRIGHLSETARCEVSGRQLLRDEVISSELSGVLVDPKLAYRSPISGRMALASECHCCEFTNELVLPDELVASDVSPRWLRRDQVCRSTVSGRIGHLSESVRCEFTSRVILSDEAARSDVSGRVTALVDLLSSEKSGRRGIESECVTCAETGRRLLRDEVAQSVVSRKWVDRDLLQASGRSGSLALPSELVLCQVTGVALLPDEAAYSDASGLTVDQRLLRKSDLSELWALENEMRTCPISGQRGLPGEFEICSITRQLVAPSVLATCAVTGQRCLQSEMVQSAVSRRWLLPAKARHDIRNGDILCPDEAAVCHWNDGWIRKQEARRCRRTGLTFAANLMTRSGEFTGIDKMLRGEMPVLDGSLLMSWLRKQADGQLKSVVSISFISSKRKRFAFAWLDMQPNMGLWGRFFAVVVIEMKDGEPKRLIGSITRCSEQAPGWEVMVSNEQ